MKAFAAYSARGMLLLSGVPTRLLFSSNPTIIVGNLHAEIGNLCAGDIEIILLSAAVLSTFDRSIKNRIAGVVFGVMTIMLLNPVRIFTVLIIGDKLGWRTADFTHDILFRLMLIIVLVGYYFIWYVKSEDIMEFVKKNVLHSHSRVRRRKKK